MFRSWFLVALALILGLLVVEENPVSANVGSAVSAGGIHTCAIAASGSAECWGDNEAGQLGNASTTNSAAPIFVQGLGAGTSTMSTGARHSCALVSGGAKCWGDNTNGELGVGTSSGPQLCHAFAPCDMTPVDVNGLMSGVARISAGNDETCAVTTAGAVKCWGYNGSEGRLGTGTNQGPEVCYYSSSQCSTIPVSVAGLGSGAAAVAVGGDVVCALTTGGGVKCWGANGWGQLGNASTGTPSATPVSVSGLASGVTAVAVGAQHACVLTTGGGVKCWGNNNFGQLGATTSAICGAGALCSTTPIDVTGLGSGVIAISAGGDNTCALTASGAVKCWGRNDEGQLGNGTTDGPDYCYSGVSCSVAPTNVSSLGSGIAAVTAGGGHACALTAAGGVECWGANYAGQLGSGTNTMSTTPLQVALVKSVGGFTELTEVGEGASIAAHSTSEWLPVMIVACVSAVTIAVGGWLLDRFRGRRRVR
jgi:alpha-tubulin suppressor-like RCC1 family protein